MSSNYDSDEDFEDYDDEDNFEPEQAGDDDYDVLPGAAISQQLSQPIPARRASTTGATGKRAPLVAWKPLVIPSAPQLSDVEMAARRFRLVTARKKMTQVKKRLEVVELDDLFQMSALTQHDMFSMGRGTYAGLVPAACQTNDDAKEEGSQTDEIPSRTYACQAPEDRSQLVEESTETDPVKDPLVQKKLGAFIQWAGPLVMAGLGMAPSQKTVNWSPPRVSGGISGGLMRLSWDALLANRPVAAVAFSPLPTEAMLLVAYGPVGAQLGAAADLIKDHSMASKGCLCLWDLTSPSRPQHVMFSEGAPTCCAFAPAPFTNIIIAGMAEGGLCVWDLEELAVRHPVETISPSSDVQLQDQQQQGESLSARRPSYSTEGTVAGADGGVGLGMGAIVAVSTVAKEGRNSPCTVVALTEWGEVQVYTCSMLHSHVGATVTDMDLGMRIGSRVRLIRNGGVVKLGTQALKPSTQPEHVQLIPSYCLAILDASSTTSATDLPAGGQKRVGAEQAPRSMSCQVLVGIEGGKVLRGGWAGTAPAPKVYITDDHRSRAVVVHPDSSAAVLAGAVVCLAASPAQPLAFLCGSSDGSVSLHRVDRSSAVAVWPSLGLGGHSIRSLAWVPSKPSCFMALDAACTLHFFDLAKSQSGPVGSESFIVQGGPYPTFPTAMAAAALRPGGHTSAPMPCFAMGQDDGGVDVHSLGPVASLQAEGGIAGDGIRETGLAALNAVLGFVGH